MPSSKKLTAAAGALGLAFAASCVKVGSLPEPPSARVVPASTMEAAIERQEICVGSSVASAGDLADTLYYRAVRTPAGQIAVGYFVFFSEERPWGNNWLTWTFLPALFVDMVYSRALLVAPGIQRVMKGKGDIEGFRVFYDVGKDGALSVEHAVADDGHHTTVSLSRAELFALDPLRPVVYSDVWSHQLGAKDARSKDDLSYVRCFAGDRVRPLPDDVARDFNADGRAAPAHVEAMGDPVTPGSGERRVAAAPVPHAD